MTRFNQLQKSIPSHSIAGQLLSEIGGILHAHKHGYWSDPVRLKQVLGNKAQLFRDFVGLNWESLRP